MSRPTEKVLREILADLKKEKNSGAGRRRLISYGPGEEPDYRVKYVGVTRFTIPPLKTIRDGLTSAWHARLFGQEYK